MSHDMDRKPKPHRRIKLLPYALLGLLVLAAGAAVIVAWAYDLLPVWRLNTAPTWQGITVSQTSAPAAVAHIGAPDAIDHRYGFLVYEYGGRHDLGWEGVELWFKAAAGEPIVAGILTTRRYPAGGAILLGDLGLRREHPQRIFRGALLPGDRFLVWPHQGIAACVTAQRASPWGLPVSEIVLFEPMSVWQAEGTLWPFPADGSSPAFGAGWRWDPWVPPGPGDLPQDPFVW